MATRAPPQPRERRRGGRLAQPHTFLSWPGHFKSRPGSYPARRIDSSASAHRDTPLASHGTQTSQVSRTVATDRSVRPLVTAGNGRGRPPGPRRTTRPCGPSVGTSTRPHRRRQRRRPAPPTRAASQVPGRLGRGRGGGSSRPRPAGPRTGGTPDRRVRRRPRPAPAGLDDGGGSGGRTGHDWPPGTVRPRCVMSSHEAGPGGRSGPYHRRDPGSTPTATPPAADRADPGGTARRHRPRVTQE